MFGQKKYIYAPPGGLEPPTFRLTAERASQLRHGGFDISSIFIPNGMLKSERSFHSFASTSVVTFDYKKLYTYILSWRQLKQ